MKSPLTKAVENFILSRKEYKCHACKKILKSFGDFKKCVVSADNVFCSMECFHRHHR